MPNSNATVFTQVNSNYTWQTNAKGYSGDQPSQSYASVDSDGGGNDWVEAQAADTYDTWVMYKPLGTESVYVPLQQLTWYWDGDAKRVSKSPESWIVTHSPIQPGTPGNTTHFPSAPDAASVATKEWNMLIPAPFNLKGFNSPKLASLP